jgi:hypothetical protein
MKKTIGIMLFLLIGLASKSFSQTATDFFAGKWEISVFGTPQGDVKFATELTRGTDGKLTGKLKSIDDTAADPINIDKAEDADGKITIYFSAQGYDLSLSLTKEDDDNLKGTLLEMFESKAKRIK